MIKKRSSIGSFGKKTVRHYWFTIVAANGEPLATSEMYTTAAMRDKGIEAVKKVVVSTVGLDYVSLKRSAETSRRISKLSDTFHLENKKGKIKKY